ncbi:MAG: type II toxin-antitoxin system HicA family toxin [Candidatus Omnitrophica bacterium]|nr:type II toxin-antitoxin system HicA family toxin [Candidatus Omnitrophota bacterium]
MSGRLPRITGKQLVRSLTKTGFLVKRIEGSHYILQKQFPEGTVTIPVPVHAGKVIKPGLMNHILRKARLSPEELHRFL